MFMGMRAFMAVTAFGTQILSSGQCTLALNTGKLSPHTLFTGTTNMKKIALAALLLPSFAFATQNLPPEAATAIQFNQWYVTQLKNGNEPSRDYAALSRYVTRDTLSKMKAMDRLDPNEYDVPDVDMFIKAQGYENDWGIVNVSGLDYDAACMQVYISFGKSRNHSVIDCMVKEDGAWKIQSVASVTIPNNLESHN